MTISLRRAFALLISTCVLFSGLTATADAATSLAKATGVKVVPGASTAVVTWSQAAGATSYRVCLRQYLDQHPCKVVTRSSTARTASFSGLRPSGGTDYYAVVLSYRGTKRTDSAPKAFNLVAAAAPGNVKRAVSAHALTVSWSAATGAQNYDVCLSTSETSTTCSRRSPRSTALSATFDGLNPTGGTDYVVRVFAYSAGGSKGSLRYAVNLPVAAVTGVTVAREAGTPNVRAAWTPADNAEQYELQFATNVGMTSGLKTLTSTQPSVTTNQVPLGASYYYRVRGTNGVVASGWTAPVKVHLASDPIDVTVLTYNLCGQDKCVTSSNGMKKWSTRKPIAGRIARGAAADIIATQESTTKDTNFGTELPGFALAAYYSAKSLFYSTARFEKLKSGIITLSATEHKYAVWAQLRDRKAGTIFIVADAHLQPSKGRTLDVLRDAQTKHLVEGIAAINPDHYPVVYAGDYNSNKSNANQSDYPGGYDAPKKVFAAAGIPDAYDTAAAKTNATWNSANQAKNPPLKHSDHVDHVYVDPLISVLQFKVVVSVVGDLYATPFGTDHNPVSVLLTIPGR